MRKRKYPIEMLEFVKNNAKGKTNLELAEMVNNKFSVNMTRKQMKSYKGNNKISSGLTGQFQKGDIPFNKGKKFPGQTNSGSFKKGNRSGAALKKYVPIGSERFSKDGYLEVKINDDFPIHKRWKSKHSIIWEEKHGPVPKGKKLIFLDQDKTNICIENLRLISDAQMLIMNQHKLITENPELTESGANIAKLIEYTNKKEVRNK